MTQKKISILVAGATLIALCGGAMLTPQYQLWQWMQRYGSVAGARERLKTNPDDAKAHLTLAWTMIHSDTAGKEVPQKEARREWDEVLRCDPSNELAVVIVAPMLIAGNQQDKERAQRLLTPIARHGNYKLRPEAEKMLRDLGSKAAR